MMLFTEKITPVFLEFNVYSDASSPIFAPLAIS
ncbi:MAG: hypothetical protein BMS9Abin02_1835 [Anaerolineae bacterium]|nr:MAG: hypothetical protein BMS9Abin02_1835 [Anaerolineae bacterium]